MLRLMVVIVLIPLFQPGFLWSQNEIDGQWIGYSGSLAGESIPNEIVTKMKLKIENGTFQATSGDLESKGTLEINSESEPKEITFRIESGEDSGREIKAIYKVRTGGISISFSQTSELPIEFESSPQNQLLSMQYNAERRSVARSRPRNRGKPIQKATIGGLQPPTGGR